VLTARAAASPSGPSSTPATCTIKVEELPAVLLASGDYELLVTGQVQLQLPSSGQVEITITQPTVVRLSGTTYHGSVTVEPADCGGEQPHVIVAAPKPAKLVFQAGAVPLSQLVVSCLAGCPHQLRPAAHFPELPFSRDTTEAIVELEFKARGHRSKTMEYRLTPGENLIRVSLQAIAG